VRVAVRIRAWPSGLIIGTSDEVELPYPAPVGVRHFDFASAVPLVPGALYFLEAFIVSGDGNPVIFSISDVYPPGQRVILYENEPHDFDPNTDLWFREGFAAPLAVESMTWGRIKALYR